MHSCKVFSTSVLSLCKFLPASLESIFAVDPLTFQTVSSTPFQAIVRIVVIWCDAQSSRAQLGRSDWTAWQGVEYSDRLNQSLPQQIQSELFAWIQEDSSLLVQGISRSNLNSNTRRCCYLTNLEHFNLLYCQARALKHLETANMSTLKIQPHRCQPWFLTMQKRVCVTPGWNLQCMSILVVNPQGLSKIRRHARTTS